MLAAAQANGTIQRRRTRLLAGLALRDLSRPDLRVPRVWPGVRAGRAAQRQSPGR